MSDLSLLWSDTDGAADLAIAENDLEQDGGLEAAVFLSLFTDRRAEDGDILPDAETDRRGWWGDAFPSVDGDRIGSRLWLLGRSKETADVLARAEEYAREALAWLVEDLVAESVATTATIAAPGVLGLSVQIYRPDRDPVRFQYSYAWAAQEARRP